MSFFKFLPLPLSVPNMTNLWDWKGDKSSVKIFVIRNRNPNVNFNFNLILITMCLHFLTIDVFLKMLIRNCFDGNIIFDLHDQENFWWKIFMSLTIWKMFFRNEISALDTIYSHPSSIRHHIMLRLWLTGTQCMGHIPRDKYSCFMFCCDCLIVLFILALPRTLMYSLVTTPPPPRGRFIEDFTVSAGSLSEKHPKRPMDRRPKDIPNYRRHGPTFTS